MAIMDADSVAEEVVELLKNIDIHNDGPHMWSSYETITAILLRLQEIHNDLALLEIYGQASPELRKVRTMVVDPSIEQVNKIANYASRKITALSIEREMDKR